MAGFRAKFVTLAFLVAASGCGDAATSAPQPIDPGTPTPGKADDFGEPSSYPGRCAGDAPAVPYQPVPGPTRAQPDGAEVLHTRVGVPFAPDYSTPPTLYGAFAPNDCGRHYYVFDLDRAARLRIAGGAYVGGEPVAVTLCFSRPRFLRIDTPWYDDIWQKDTANQPTLPCGRFVPVGDGLEPDDGRTLDLPPGAYELTIDPEAMGTEYELAVDFEPLGDAVCGNGVREPGEGCDDGGQEPLDWCGSDCRPQRLDVEPITGNETSLTAQALDGFRIVNFYAPPGEKQIDVYQLDLAAGEVVELHRGERTCRDTWVQLYDGEGRPIAEPWDCNSMLTTHEYAAASDGTYFLRFETVDGGARSVSIAIR